MKARRIMAAVTAPARVGAQHQSLLHLRILIEAGFVLLRLSLLTGAGRCHQTNVHRPFFHPSRGPDRQTGLAIYLNVNARPVVLDTRSTEVVSVV